MSEDCVQGTFWYFKRIDAWTHEKPYFINLPASAPPSGQATTNEISEPAPRIAVQNFRNEEQSLTSLDARGFTLVRDPICRYGLEAFTDTDAMRAEYVPKMEARIKELLGAEEVMTTTVSIRRRDPDFPKYTWGKTGDSQPIQGVHIDCTPRFARNMLQMKFGKERADAFSGRRSQILNVWRPLFGPLRDWPLGMIDF